MSVKSYNYYYLPQWIWKSNEVNESIPWNMKHQIVTVPYIEIESVKNAYLHTRGRREREGSTCSKDKESKDTFEK